MSHIHIKIVIVFFKPSTIILGSFINNPMTMGKYMYSYIKRLINKITKIVSGMDEDTTEKLALLYGTITKVYKTSDIKTAEAAKVIENIQRDLNIALMNELSLIFNRMDIDTKSVLDAAETKWNFHRYDPGLVGGHCIPVDPYYLVYKSKELGYHPQVILAGRSINDYMPKHVAELTIKSLNNEGKVILLYIFK